MSWLPRRRARAPGLLLVLSSTLLGCADSPRDDGGSAAGGSQAGPSAAAGGASGTAGAGQGGASAVSGAGGAGRGGAGAGGGAAAGSSAAGAGVSAGSSAGDDAGAGGSSTPSDAAACTPCSGYADPQLIGNVQLAELDQLSGIAVSARDAAVLFAHNDRTSTSVFALGLDGALLARFELQGVTSVDLEDIAVGACPSGSCLYVADIGGNLAPRDEYAILRTPEPEVDPDAPSATAVELEVERFRFAYEDGAHNAEGILIDPGSGRLYVVTKEAAGQPSHVYRLPEALDAGALNMATKVADLSVPRAGDSPATASSAHPCGAGFLLRTGDQLYEFRIDPSQPFEDAFAVEPALLAAGDEPQSEGVSYLLDGSGFVSCGEMASAPIYRSTCAP